VYSSYDPDESNVSIDMSQISAECAIISDLMPLPFIYRIVCLCWFIAIHVNELYAYAITTLHNAYPSTAPLSWMCQDSSGYFSKIYLTPSKRTRTNVGPTALHDRYSRHHGVEAGCLGQLSSPHWHVSQMHFSVN